MFVKIVEIATYILPRRLLPLLPRISSRLVCRRWGQVRLPRPHLLRRHRPFQRRSSAFWPTLFSVTLPCWPLSPLSGKKHRPFKQIGVQGFAFDPCDFVQKYNWYYGVLVIYYSCHSCSYCSATIQYSCSNTILLVSQGQENALGWHTQASLSER